jgi:transposase InsO family protein/transposase-like protein
VPAYVTSKAKTFKIKVRRWALVYRMHGAEALRHGKTRHFTPDQKLAAVRRGLAGEALTAVAASLGMPDCSIVLSWQRAYLKSGLQGLQSRQGRRPRDAKGEGREDGGKLRAAAPERGELQAAAGKRLLKKIEGLGGRGGASPRLRAEAVREILGEIPSAGLKDLLQAAGLAKSTYFFEAGRRDPDARNAETARLISDIFEENRSRYGVRRVTAELRRRGLSVNHKRVQRLMRKMGLAGIRRRIRYNSYVGGEGRESPDLLLSERADSRGRVRRLSDFGCSRPDEKWTTDVSQFTLPGGTKCYLAPVKDMFTGEIVSYDFALSPDLARQMRMLGRAFAAHGCLRGTVFHSDQGWQYRHPAYMAALRGMGIRQSMSRKGNCLGNCIMESFFGTMKNEMFYGHEREFGCFADLAAAVGDYIRDYNTRRLRYFADVGLYMTPSERRAAWSAAEAKSRPSVCH